MSIEVIFTDQENPDISFQASGYFFTKSDLNKDIDTRLDKWEIRYDTKSSCYGSAIFYTRIDADGKMWIGNFEYESQVNFCPITGRKADVLIDNPNIEEQ